MRTDQQDIFQAFQKRREHLQRQQQQDPMQLEFKQIDVIMRLNRMKNVLAKGVVVNQKQLASKMCESLEASKQFN